MEKKQTFLKWFKGGLGFVFLRFKKLTMSKKGVAGDWSLYYLLRSYYGVLAVTIFTKDKIRGFG